MDLQKKVGRLGALFILWSVNERMWLGGELESLPFFAQLLLSPSLVIQKYKLRYLRRY